MSIPLSEWEKLRTEMEPYIKAFEEQISFEEFDMILEQTVNKLNEKYNENHKELVSLPEGK